jgi:dipeptidyl aminopeptidase/acylaminoacyl peptidase
VIQIIHGETDLIVPTASSRSLFQALTECGVDCRYELIPGQGHLVTYLHPKTKATMLAFFDEVLAPPSP